MGYFGATGIISPHPALLPTLPRVGMLLEMPASFARVSYFGRGPHENYCDRKSSAFVGRHSASVQVRMLPRQSAARR